MPPKKNQVLVACATCRTEFTVKASRAKQNNAITCSKECLSTLRSRNRVKHFGTADARQATCATCAQPFTRKPSQLTKYGQSYCGRTCANVGRSVPNLKLRTGKWFACEKCGKAAWRTAATAERHVYCSRLCANRDPKIRTPRPHVRGSKNWRWKGGFSLLPYGPGWTKKLRISIRERDGYCCQACSLETRTPGRLAVHHKDWGKTNHHPSNLVTLCLRCHSRLHHGKLRLG